MKRRSVTAGQTRTSGSSSHCWSISTTKPGVEKVFILLERLIREPKRYQDAAGISLDLFFSGISQALQSGSTGSEFEQIYRRLYHVLHKLRGDAPFPAVTPGQKNPGRALSAHQSPDC